MLRLAHTGNRCTHVRIRKNKAKRHFGKSHSRWKDFLELFYTFDGRRKIVGAEIVRAPVADGELRIQGELAAEAAFVKRNSRNHADVQLAARGEQFVLWRLIEDVVNHLYRIHEPGSQRPKSVLRLPAIQTESKCLDESLAFKFLDR